jgi:hypothetical protein
LASPHQEAGAVGFPFLRFTHGNTYNH